MRGSKENKETEYLVSFSFWCFEEACSGIKNSQTDEHGVIVLTAVKI